MLWCLVTVIRLDRFTRVLSFGFRYTAYLTALGLAIYVYNERRVTRAKFVRWISWFWVAAIIGGYLAFVMPNTVIKPTLASILLPESITSNDFVGNLVRPGFAQVQNLFGVPVPRPKTLFPFTNEWGGNVGLLTPFFVASFLYSPLRRERRFGTIMLIVALPPMIISVNRGLWISVALIFVLVAFRSFKQGNTFALKMLMGAILLIGFLVIATPLGEVVGGRLERLRCVHPRGHLRRGVARRTRVAAARLGRSPTVREPVLAVDRHARSLLAGDVRARLRRAGAVHDVGGDDDQQVAVAVATRCR